MSALSDALDRFLSGDDQALKSYFLKGKPMVARSDASGFPPERPKKATYPWIGVSAGGTIALFTSDGVGTVIGHSAIVTPGTLTNNPLGMHTGVWVSSCFTPYSGKVTLYNE